MEVAAAGNDEARMQEVQKLERTLGELETVAIGLLDGRVS
jgi:hypothetical protein